MDDEDFDFGSDPEFEDDGLLNSDVPLRNSGDLLRNSGNKELKEYSVLNEVEVFGRCEDKLTRVCEICDVRRGTAAALLRQLKWDPERVIEQMLDEYSKAKLMKSVGLSEIQRQPSLRQTSQIHCLICYDVVETEKTFSLNCGHTYCTTCWKSYLEYAINCGMGCIYTKCMYPDCTQLVEDNIFEKICSPQSYKRYIYFFYQEFVADNPYMKWCPFPGCPWIIQTERKQCIVVCNCGFSFCFACANFEIGDHMPANCEQIAKWIAKENDEAETVKWMRVHTKTCPACGYAIEKNGGCMHMTCPKMIGGCGHEFCWLCRGPWSEHGSSTGGYYNCNKYSTKDAAKEEASLASIKSELERYKFHYHRYEAHRDAHKIANTQLEQAEAKGVEMQIRFNVRPLDTIFLMDATRQLLRNRQVLQYSYAYGYFLTQEGAERNLFLYLQEDLEKHTNALSTLYERANLPDYTAFIKWQEQVINYTNVTRKFLDKFVEGVIHGLTSTDGL
jgi:ariadne-1